MKTGAPFASSTKGSRHMCHDSCPHPISGGEHLHEDHITLPVGDEQLPVFTVMPERSPAPAVMIIHDIHGPNTFYQDLARRLAAAGFTAALPDFFFRQDPVPAGDSTAARERGSKVVQAKTFEDIAAVLTFLTTHPNGTGRIGTIGMCWGGSMVMLAASRQPVPHASVPFYGFPVRQRTENNPVLALDDDQVSSVATPMLAFWGDQDSGVGMDNVAAYDEKLTRHGKPHEFVIYPGIGHGFLTFDPDSPAYEHSREAWTRTLAFLEEHLGAETLA
jgi:carboxymethylenebutenolidase